MTTDWETFFTQTPFDSTTDCTLNDWAVLSVRGDDAHDFLQNMLTNDVLALANNQAQLSGLCNPKGRLLATFWLLRRDEAAFDLILPHSVLPGLQQRLQMYILRSKVTLKEAKSLRVHGLTSTDALAFPDAVLSGEEKSHGTYILRLTDVHGLPRALALHDVSAVDDTNTTAMYWTLLDCAAGIGFITQDTIEQFTPQHINLDLVGGVSFNKGCYPGQEIVARLHYLGAPSRRAFMSTIDTDTPPINGAEITTATGDVAGHIIQSAIVDSVCYLMISLKLKQLDTPLHLVDVGQLKNLQALHNER